MLCLRALLDPRHALCSGLLLGAAFSLTTAAHAQVVLAPATPLVGSSNPASSEPGVKRPTTTPCVVSLFTDESFNDFNSKDFSYTPPAACKGPWAKVVLTADFTVTEGRQFDRTAQFFIGGANVYFGTTAEPRKALSPSWHVERDVTDLSALFKTSQAGVASLGNFIGVSGGVTYDGYIYGNAALEFYPANLANLPPLVPDAVLPVNPNSAAYALNTKSDVMAATFTLPRNVEAAYLDLITQSQSNDEFWYTCSPSQVAAELNNCGNTAFREAEISVDGKPAGIAPIYPWVYTGGIDPYLWEPTVGVQTLDFKPYRVDLTPYAGVLSDGLPHTVGVSVYNANGYFAATANLLLFLDRGAEQTWGAVTGNTLLTPNDPYVKNDYATDATGGISGTSLVTQQHHYNVAGYVNTSHGRVDTEVDAYVNFGNYQTVVNDATHYKQTIQQLSGAYSVTKTRDGFLNFETDQLAVYPFTLNYVYVVNGDGTQSIASTITQQNYGWEKQLFEGFEYYSSTKDENVKSNDTLEYTAAGAFASHAGASTASDQESDSLGSCWSRVLTSSTAVLTRVTDGAGCGGTNHQ